MDGDAAKAHGDGKRAALLGRAEAAGVLVEYEDQGGQPVQSSDAAVAAVLDLLESTGLGNPRPVTVTPSTVRDIPAIPDPPAWGFSVFLPGLRSAASWGVGDAVDLAALAGFAAELGADALYLNPTLAEVPAEPIEPSPYLPATRLFGSLLHLRPEAVPEAAGLGVDGLAQMARLQQQAAAACADRLDRDAVYAAKTAAVRLLAAVPMTPERTAALHRFRAASGPALEAFARWSALVQRYGPLFREWPAPWGDAAAVAQLPPEALDEPLRVVADAVVRTQFWLDEQWAWAQQAARAAGMRIGLVHDLPVGVHPAGFDPWFLGDVLVAGASVGAPPDRFNALGQDWSQPPWHPRRLLEEDCRPFAAAIAAGLRHGGGLRVDHALGLFRSWWIPRGAGPGDGAYVRNPADRLLAELAGAAAAAGAVVVAEDLGTVGADVRAALAARNLLGTVLMLFSRDPVPIPPQRVRADVLAALSTHDLPPAASWWSGEHVELREALGLLPDVAAARAAAAEDISTWSASLRDWGFLEAAGDVREAPVEEAVVALHRWLAATPAALKAVQLGDAVGDPRPVNVPGTVDEYPNWRLPLADGAGRLLMLEDLPDSALLRAVAAAMGGPADRHG